MLTDDIYKFGYCRQTLDPLMNYTFIFFKYYYLKLANMKDHE